MDIKSRIKKLSKEYKIIKNSGMFDESFYLSSNLDVKESGIDPIIHYIEYGEVEGRAPHVYCDLDYLKTQITDPMGLTYFAYFCINERKEHISLNIHFDPTFYMQQYCDVESEKIGLFDHFLHTGIYEKRLPANNIDSLSYFGISQPSSVNKDINPAHKSFKEKGPSYEEPLFLNKKNNSKVKALAYYLPQFHPFEENEQWWGQGFTEWTNVTKGEPRFKGHYQPHLPNHLGYYDLRVKDVFIRQVEYAKAGGLHGFCFYHYWFNGKRLMEKPVNMFLENKDIDFPFCLMWANENWTRTWDGLSKNVLISQDYYDEDDIPFIEDLGRHFADSRYIRIDGRPLFFIYRPGLIPNFKQKIKLWRELCEQLLGESPLFYMAQAFGDHDPREFGMDGAIEFPPHKIASDLPDKSRLQGQVDKNFTGHYPAYDDLVQASLSEKYPDFPLIRGVTPSWDNEARRRNRGMGFLESTPEKYEDWLSKIAKQSLENPISPNESFVIINAWNEWAEGAHLEPDIYYGAAYLNSTFKALNNTASKNKKPKLLLVGHDANKHGAQLLTLNIFKTLKRRFGIDVVCVLLDGGPLTSEYKNIGETYTADGSLEKFKEVVQKIHLKETIKSAICNTTVTGLCVKHLSQLGINTLSLVHELPTLINEYKLQGHAKAIVNHANNVVFAADFVKEQFCNIVGDSKANLVVKPQGIYQTLTENKQASKLLRDKLNLNHQAKIVVNSGFADLRKGFDLFIQIAKAAVKRDDSFHFVWLGNIEAGLNNWVLRDIQDTALMKHIHIVPFTLEISLYLEGADVFAMTSREDPFPSVVLESLALGTPVVGFENGGGFVDAIAKPQFGTIVPMADTLAFVDAIELHIKRDTKQQIEERKKVAVKTYDWNDYVFSLLEYLNPELKRVSVAVPNYNYERHITERLVSIFDQSYPIYELIVLDDKSTDNSTQIIKEAGDAYQRDFKLIFNDENSGSVFKQWAKGANLAKGDYLWIAEADDLADANFLSVIMDGENDFSMAYTDSEQIDGKDQHLADDYRYYYDESMIEKLDKPDVYNGKDVIKDCLSVKNQFMNVSSIVFNTREIKECINNNIDELCEFKVAGDWFIYIKLLLNKTAKCKLVAESLNTHRRHSDSVTKKNYSIQLAEIKYIQKWCADEVNADTKKQEFYIKEVAKVLKGEQL